LFLIFTVLHKKFMNERKEKSEEVHILFYLFFFKTYLKPSYRTKTEWYDRMIHDHSKMLKCLFFVMLITSIFFFNVRMVSMFPYGVCSPRDFNWFKVQKLGGLNKYVYRCCKDVWRNRFWKVGKAGLWSIFIDSVLSFLLTVENLFKL